eukprot:749278-Hanusia_phi.AAC.4
MAEISAWLEGDDPMEMHAQRSPDCEFVKSEQDWSRRMKLAIQRGRGITPVSNFLATSASGNDVSINVHHHLTDTNNHHRANAHLPDLSFEDARATFAADPKFVYKKIKPNNRKARHHRHTTVSNPNGFPKRLQLLPSQAVLQDATNENLKRATPELELAADEAGSAMRCRDEDEEEDQEPEGTGEEERCRGRLDMTIVCARNLPKMDAFGSCDGFCTIDFLGSTKETSVKPNNYFPEWRESFVYTIPNTLEPGKLVITVLDHDKIGSPEVVGYVTLDSAELSSVMKGICGKRHVMTYKIKSKQGKTVVGNNGEEAELVVELMFFMYFLLEKKVCAEDRMVRRTESFNRELAEQYMIARKKEVLARNELRQVTGVLSSVCENTEFVFAELWRVHNGTLMEDTTGIDLGTQLMYIGEHYIQSSYFDLHPQDRRKRGTREEFEELQELHTSTRVKIGEGVEGMALQRGSMEFRVLQEMVDNPEIQREKRYELSSQLFHSACAFLVGEEE